MTRSADICSRVRSGPEQQPTFDRALDGVGQHRRWPRAAVTDVRRKRPSGKPRICVRGGRCSWRKRPQAAESGSQRRPKPVKYTSVVRLSRYPMPKSDHGGRNRRFVVLRQFRLEWPHRGSERGSDQRHQEIGGGSLAINGWCAIVCPSQALGLIFCVAISSNSS
jgi:hypothetical protein